MIRKMVVDDYNRMLHNGIGGGTYRGRLSPKINFGDPYVDVRDGDVVGIFRVTITDDCVTVHSIVYHIEFLPRPMAEWLFKLDREIRIPSAGMNICMIEDFCDLGFVLKKKVLCA